MSNFADFSSASPMQTVLTIAGFDPSSGAGVTADLMVFAAHSLFGTSAITALTVQSTVGVRSMHPVSPEILRATLECLSGDLPPSGIKIGMLGSGANVEVVCDYIDEVRRHPPGSAIPVVLDPVLRSSSGRELLDAQGVILLRDRLLPLVDWVTPNLAELAELTGSPVPRREDLPGICRNLQEQVSEKTGWRRLGVLATGGDLNPPDDFLLTVTDEEVWLPGERVATRATHGTGCALSSSFLSRLVLGDPPSEASSAAKEYVSMALRFAIPRGAGHGPMNLLWDKSKFSH
jgi:hydroxymethylpyrimidine/phosphomethylpyrimidine kinase